MSQCVEFNADHTKAEYKKTNYQKGRLLISAQKSNIELFLKNAKGLQMGNIAMQQQCKLEKAKDGTVFVKRPTGRSYR